MIQTFGLSNWNNGITIKMENLTFDISIGRENDKWHLNILSLEFRRQVQARTVTNLRVVKDCFLEPANIQS